MKQVTFDINEFNFMSVGDDEFFLYQIEDDFFMVPAQCPHRGGPLHLGCKVKDGYSITCPWHENTVKERFLMRSALEVKIKGSEVSVHIKNYNDEPILLQKKTILA